MFFLRLISWSIYNNYFWKMEKEKKENILFRVNFGCFCNAWECNRWQVNTALFECPQSALCSFALIAIALLILGSPFPLLKNHFENTVFPNHPLLVLHVQWQSQSCWLHYWHHACSCSLWLWYLAEVWDTCVHWTFPVLYCCFFLVILLMRKQLRKINGFKL